MRQGERAHHGLKGSLDWLEWAAGLPADPVPYGPSAASQLIVSGRVILTALNFANGGTAGGQLTLNDGTDSKGQPIYIQGMGANQSGYQSFSPRGILCEQGVYLQNSGISVQAVIYVIHLWRYAFTPPGE